MKYFLMHSRHRASIKIPKNNPAIHLVIERLADWPKGEELEGLQSFYFKKFLDGDDRALVGNLSCARVKATWARLSDFRTEPSKFQQLGTSEYGLGSTKSALRLSERPQFHVLVDKLPFRKPPNCSRPLLHQLKSAFSN